MKANNSFQYCYFTTHFSTFKGNLCSTAYTSMSESALIKELSATLYKAVFTSKFGELWSSARQQLWPWSMSKVRVTAWCQLQGLLTRIIHAKYQFSIINTSEDSAMLKFLWQTDIHGTNGRMSFNVPRFRERRETKIVMYILTGI